MRQQKQGRPLDRWLLRAWAIELLYLNQETRHGVAQRAARQVTIPMGVRLPPQGCRTWIWAQAQMHERRRSPIRPLCFVTGGPAEPPQHAHRARRIARKDGV